MAPHRVRHRIRVRGVVQGVGFRPFVYRLARDADLAGFVLNDAHGVLIEVEGPPGAIEALITALEHSPPPLARIDDMTGEAIAPTGERAAFRVAPSRSGAGVATAIGPDVAVCPDCLAEMRDPADRRYGYPFLNCTHCGPRYTITHRLPYDRAQTAMAPFVMCGPCAAEYHTPTDRRFHAQPTACPDCGPAMDMAPAEIIRRLRAGQIVAIKGLGGFHLACDARNPDAIAQLRQRKDREQKPLAVMVADTQAVRAVVHLDGQQTELLESPARPIVLARKVDGALPEGLAPGLGWLGVMLPYAPLHYLLFAGPDPLVLVMTSANPGGEPLVIDNDEAVTRLAGIADAIASHDREIVVRADDSVVRMVNGAPGFVRRARGYVPDAIRLPRSMPSVLAVGGSLKVTICVTRDDEAFVSQHIGNLDTPTGVRFFEETVDHLLNLLNVTPSKIAHDLHPDFFSTRYAQDRAVALGIPAVGVQHHQAHLAAVMAEHGLDHPVLGLALDGHGLGHDGGAWGGELMVLDGPACDRIGHLRPLAQPGGDVAAREPWRMGLAALHGLGRTDEAQSLFGDHNGLTVVSQIVDKGVNAPMTSSCGRVFDAACGLLGVIPVASYEGQAPMALEGLVTAPEVMADGWRIDRETLVLDLRPLLGALIGQDPVRGANLFHGTVIAALTDWAIKGAERTGIRHIALGGGCLLNHIVATGLDQGLRQGGLEPYFARQVPPNDGGISLGQAWIAGQI